MESEALNPAVTEGGFSMFGLLLEADLVVKLVLIVLFIASLWSWAVIIEKWFSAGRGVEHRCSLAHLCIHLPGVDRGAPRAGRR